MKALTAAAAGAGNSTSTTAVQDFATDSATAAREGEVGASTAVIYDLSYLMTIEGHQGKDIPFGSRRF